MMNREDIIKYRLACQHITGGPIEKPEDMVAWMGCVQAQDYAGAKWAVGSRLRSAGNAGQGPDAGPVSGAVQVADAGIEQAFVEGRIIRTHVLRPTWHFVAPADIRWMLALTSPRVKAGCAGYRRQLGLDKEIFRRSNAILKKALKGGKQLDRKALAMALQRGGIHTGDERMGHLLMEAELDGIICSGGLKGKQFTYALLEEWVPAGREIKKDEALAELTMRYFKSRGPATLADFAWWSGLTIGDAKMGIEANLSQFDKVTVEDRVYWYHTSISGAIVRAVSGKASVSGDRASDMRVLPAFDEYTVAYTDRDLMLHPKHALRGGNGIFKPVIIQDGQVVGIWKRTIKKGGVFIDTDLFKQVGKRALREAFAGYGAFVGKQVIFGEI